MRRTVLHLASTLCIFCFAAAGAQSQGFHDHVWVLGHLTPQGEPSPMGLEFDFNHQRFDINLTHRPASMYLMNASYCNDVGDLVAYTNGCDIYNASHELVTNGTDLNPGEVHETQCVDYSGYSVAESGVFLPLNDSTFELYHIGIEWEFNPTDVFAIVLYQTTLQTDGETYQVVAKNVPIINDTLGFGNLEAVKHIDDGWWLITRRRKDNLYYRVHVSQSGGVSLDTQRIGLIHNSQGEGSGQAVFSPDGTKYATYNKDDNLYLFDFDRSTGLLSEFRQIHVSDSGFVGGVAFSPNSRFLYVSSQVDLYQLDTWAQDPEKSVVHIDHWDGFSSPFPATFYLMQLGPDCRIYMIPNNGIDVMHVINRPDLPGKECNFVQHGIELPTFNSITIPNFPNYRLGTGPVCDSSITTSAPTLVPQQNALKIWPNPSSGVFKARVAAPGSGRLVLYTIDGVSVYESQISAGESTIEVDAHVPPGVYFCAVVTKGTSAQVTRVVVH